MKTVFLFPAFLLVLSCVKEASPQEGRPLVFDAAPTRGTKASKMLELSAPLRFSAYLSDGSLSPDDARPDFAYDEICRRRTDGLYVSENVFPPVDFNTWEKARFYIYGPATASGLEISPSTTAGPPYLDYTVPSDVSLQSDLIAGRSEEYRREDFRSEVSLKYGRLSKASACMTHLLSCISLRTDSDGIASATLKSVTLKGVRASGRYLMAEGVWTGLSEPTADFSVDLDIEMDGTPFQNLLCSDDGTALMMIPQTVARGAVIEVGITDSQGDRVCSASIGGDVWAAGFDAVYSIHLDRQDGSIVVAPFEPGGEQNEIL